MVRHCGWPFNFDDEGVPTPVPEGLFFAEDKEEDGEEVLFGGSIVRSGFMLSAEDSLLKITL